MKNNYKHDMLLINMNEEFKNDIISAPKENLIFDKIDTRMKLNKWQEFSIGFFGYLLMYSLLQLPKALFPEFVLVIYIYILGFTGYILPIILIMSKRTLIGVGIIFSLFFLFSINYILYYFNIHIPYNAGAISGSISW